MQLKAAQFLLQGPRFPLHSVPLTGALLKLSNRRSHTSRKRWSRRNEVLRKNNLLPGIFFAQELPRKTKTRERKERVLSTPNMTGRRFHRTMDMIPAAPGSLKAPLLPPLLNNVQTRERKGYRRGTARNFLHSFPLSSSPVVQSYWAWIL